MECFVFKRVFITSVMHADTYRNKLALLITWPKLLSWAVSWWLSQIKELPPHARNVSSCLIIKDWLTGRTHLFAALWNTWSMSSKTSIPYSKSVRIDIWAVTIEWFWNRLFYWLHHRLIESLIKFHFTLKCTKLFFRWLFIN